MIRKEENGRMGRGRMSKVKTHSPTLSSLTTLILIEFFLISTLGPDPALAQANLSRYTPHSTLRIHYVLAPARVPQRSNPLWMGELMPLTERTVI